MSEAIPWYKSKIIVGVGASMLSKGLVLAGLSNDLGGELATVLVTGLGLIGDCVALVTRARQTKAAPITMTKAHAELKNIQVAADMSAEHPFDLVDQGFEALQSNVVLEPFPSQATALLAPVEHAPVVEAEDEPYEREIMFGSLVTEEFKQGVLWIEEQIGLKADFLMCCMHFETGGSFSPSVKNAAGSSGLGLIQFMRATIEGPRGMLAKTPSLKKIVRSHAELAQLSAVQQLSFVYYYFKAFGNDLSDWSIEDVYMAILYPAAIGKSLSWHMPWAAGSLAYKQNAGLDLNRDKVITKAEAAAGVSKRQKLGEQLKG